MAVPRRFYPFAVLLNICSLGSRDAVAADTVGTGGISVNFGNESWPALEPDLPHVTMLSHGFQVQTANGYLVEVPSDNQSRDRFLTLWLQLHDPHNGYFSSVGLPFHSAETLIVEAPDYGHLTTSETISYWAWLEATFGRYTGDYRLLHYVFERMEAIAIPPVQSGTNAYNANAPATYAPEADSASSYPVPFDQSARPGVDPLAGELTAAYGSSIYGMHWLIDTTNWYGYGQGSAPVLINTFERGPMESVFLTVPHPEIDELKYGAPGQGFLGLFASDPTGFKRQWRYTNAPDADARVVQATYWAAQFARAAGNAGAVSDLVGKASRMGDYLRYAMFDKYFKTMGCPSPNCPAGTGYDAAHFLLAWYYAWGGSYPEDPSWSWRIGGSHAHFGYQNPLAAFAMSQDAEFLPKTPHGASDWQQSLHRQLEFYQWLQSAEGAIAGGATNSWQGRYSVPPAGQSTFYNLSFDPNPVFHNPNSNNWFGWQAWSMERVAEYYAESGDHSVEPLLDRWVIWVSGAVKLTSEGSFQIPVTLAWSGQPQPWTPQAPAINSALHVTISEFNEDVGIATSVAKALLNYVHGSIKYRHQDQSAAAALARELVSRTWTHYADSKGVTNDEPRPDYSNFNASVYVPPGYTGSLANGAALNSQATFISLRPNYRNDPDFPRVQAYLNGSAVPVFRYHRFWTEVEAAVAFSEYDRLSGH